MLKLVVGRIFSVHPWEVELLTGCPVPCNCFPISILRMPCCIIQGKSFPFPWLHHQQKKMETHLSFLNHLYLEIISDHICKNSTFLCGTLHLRSFFNFNTRDFSNKIFFWSVTPLHTRLQIPPLSFFFLKIIYYNYFLATLDRKISHIKEESLRT